MAAIAPNDSFVISGWAARRLLGDLQANYGLKPLRKGLWSREALQKALIRAGLLDVNGQ